VARTRSSRIRFALFFGCLSVAVFAITANAVGSGAARSIDERYRRRFTQARSPFLDLLSAAVTMLTSPALLIVSSLATAFRFRRFGARVWLPIASAPFVAMIAGRTFPATLTQQFAPFREGCEPEACFPSGHTTGATAEALTTSLVLRRNGLIGRSASTAIACIPLISGANRLYRDRHWTSDIIAGLSAGAAIAIALATISEWI
jgi:membrane-associated phospholipid phosphatase